MQAESLKDFIIVNRKKFNNIVYIAAAGFEDRNIATSTIFKEIGMVADNSIILKYPNQKLNKKSSIKIIGSVSNVSINTHELEINEDCFNKISRLIEIIKPEQFLVDITGMDRLTIFKILDLIDNIAIPYFVIYTEAEEYFPSKNFYLKLIKNTKTREEAFENYLQKEKAQIVYSFDCDMVSDRVFNGNPEPGKPAMLIAFLTYKRSRLQIILQNMEFEKKIYIITQPVREDLKWRKEYLEIANYDLIRKNPYETPVLETIYLQKTLDLLEEICYKNNDFAEYNLFFAPLGSKVQTLGSYLFWKKHKEMSIIFSQPREYFKDSYSKSFRDTFIFEL